MTLKQISQFQTDDPGKLGRQLSQLEENVHAECTAIRTSFPPLPNVTTRISLPAPKPAAFALQPDEQASFDTVLGNLSGILPPLIAANFGRRFIVIKRAAAGTLNVLCRDPAVLLNGAAGFPLAITAAGATVFYCDAAGYYK